MENKWFFFFFFYALSLFIYFFFHFRPNVEYGVFKGMGMDLDFFIIFFLIQISYYSYFWVNNAFGISKPKAKLDQTLLLTWIWDITNVRYKIFICDPYVLIVGNKILSVLKGGCLFSSFFSSELYTLFIMTHMKCVSLLQEIRYAIRNFFECNIISCCGIIRRIKKKWNR